MVLVLVEGDHVRVGDDAERLVGTVETILDVRQAGRISKEDGHFVQAVAEDQRGLDEGPERKVCHVCAGMPSAERAIDTEDLTFVVGHATIPYLQHVLLFPISHSFDARGGPHQVIVSSCLRFLPKPCSLLSHGINPALRRCHTGKDLFGDVHHLDQGFRHPTYAYAEKTTHRNSGILGVDMAPATFGTGT